MKAPRFSDSILNTLDAVQAELFRCLLLAETSRRQNLFIQFAYDRDDINICMDRYGEMIREELFYYRAFYYERSIPSITIWEGCQYLSRHQRFNFVKELLIDSKGWNHSVYVLWKVDDSLRPSCRIKKQRYQCSLSLHVQLELKLVLCHVALLKLINNATKFFYLYLVLEIFKI